MSVLVLVAHIAAMRAAWDRGDLDEVARQGQLAGPVAVERAVVGGGDRATVLAAIAAAPSVTDAIELLPALAVVAGGPDRRTAIPAARAAVAIARGNRGGGGGVVNDEVAGEDVAAWRLAWVALAMRRDRFVEVRVAALEVASDLVDGGVMGYELAAVLGEPDAAVREAGVAFVPVELPSGVKEALAAVVAKDADDGVALAAGDALCVAGVVFAVEAKARIGKLVKDDPRRPAARCAR